MAANVEGRQNRKLNSVPLVFISGLPAEGGPRKSMVGKVEGYLVKPFKLEELMEVVQRCLDQATARDRP
jgi:response regulator RpfG family c-di-GMP phosphodiesterase